MRNWYVISTGNHQGLVVEEGTGANIAVTYDAKHAPLVAAAPDLLAACEAMAAELGGTGDFAAWEAAKAQLLAAIAKSKAFQ